MPGSEHRSGQGAFPADDPKRGVANADDRDRDRDCDCGCEEEGPRSEAGRYSYDGLDRVLHEKARLGIMVALLANAEGLVFNELKHCCALTDGNLSRHLDVLREAGLIEVRKEFHDKRPQTTCRLSALGRARFEEYLDELARVVRDGRRLSPGASSGVPGASSALRGPRSMGGRARMELPPAPGKGWAPA